MLHVEPCLTASQAFICFYCFLFTHLLYFSYLMRPLNDANVVILQERKLVEGGGGGDDRPTRHGSLRAKYL